VTVTQLDGALGYHGCGGETSLALSGGLGGLVKAYALEALDLYCRALDFAPELPTSEVAVRFAAELRDAATDVREVGHDGAGRRTPALFEAPTRLVRLCEDAATAEPAQDDLLVVTGGACARRGPPGGADARRRRRRAREERGRHDIHVDIRDIGVAVPAQRRRRGGADERTARRLLG
jgi:hypothetical protein